MPACGTHTEWLRRFQENRTPDFNPVFSAWLADQEPEGMSNQLRSAFQFLRRHGDGRYGAQSLMKLLNAADAMDADTFDQNEVPKVLLAEVPYSYDEDTEVKSGGIVGVAVVLADGRLMMAVNRNTRRRRVGAALYGWATEYAHTAPVVWVHQANIVGAQFCLSRGLQPREVNSRGAVAFCIRHPQQDNDDLAVEGLNEYELEEAIAMASHRRGASRPRRRNILAESPSVAELPLASRNRYRVLRPDEVEVFLPAPAPEPDYYIPPMEAERNRGCGDLSCRECYDAPVVDFDREPV